MEDRIRQLEKAVQEERKVAQDYADSFDEVWRNHEDAIKSLKISRSENRALRERIQKIEAEVQSLKDQIAGYEGGMQAYEIPMVERLRSAARTIWEQEQERTTLMTQVQEVAQLLQVLVLE
ncbi:hypothetical protein V6N11_021124 [Hibiscus sabdariffa]|uniref:Uncharacterized protein n=2 Tax=Hibiscus sabdariffa TaxID=183260 RepID=A0ABR2NGM7_9ROSI